MFLYFSIIEYFTPKVDADAGVKSKHENTDISQSNSEVDDNSESESELEDGQPKKKLRKEKVGFRDRKVL